MVSNNAKTEVCLVHTSLKQLTWYVKTAAISNV